jgi:hypothetical protein
MKRRMTTRKKRNEKGKRAAIQGNISMDYIYDVMRETHETKDIVLEDKCFFFIVFNTPLMPSTSFYLTIPQMHAAFDLERLGRINWRMDVLNHFAKCIRAWKNHKADNISCCVTLLLVSIFKTIIFHE